MTEYRRSYRSSVSCIGLRPRAYTAALGPVTRNHLIDNIIILTILMMYLYRQISPHHLNKRNSTTHPPPPQKKKKNKNKNTKNRKTVPFFCICLVFFSVLANYFPILAYFFDIGRVCYRIGWYAVLPGFTSFSINFSDIKRMESMVETWPYSSYEKSYLLW